MEYVIGGVSAVIIVVVSFLTDRHPESVLFPVTLVTFIGVITVVSVYAFLATLHDKE
jgi:hypothetical protein